MLDEKEKDFLFHNFTKMMGHIGEDDLFYNLLWTGEEEYEDEDRLVAAAGPYLEENGVASGASKLVFFPKFTDKWVYKIPLRGERSYEESETPGQQTEYLLEFDRCGQTLNIPDVEFDIKEWDHCYVESVLTEYLEEDNANIADIFAKTYMIGEYGVPIYVSERCSTPWYEKYTSIRQTEVFSKTKSVYKDSMSKCDIFLDSRVIFTMCYGLKKANELFDFLDKTNIQDMHNGNLAFDANNKARIIDYSGYGYQSWY